MPVLQSASPLERLGRDLWWRRIGSPGHGFEYIDPEGHLVRDVEAHERILDLAIPPAWEQVRVSPHPHGRLQAIGLDAAGRLQYRYNPAFVAKRQHAKYAKIEHFGERLAEFRATTSRHLARPGLPKEKILALVTRLVNRLYFRLGSRAGARRYRTFGITTLRKSHLQVRRDGALLFTFTGKHHIHHRRIIADATIVRLLKELKHLPGPQLFQFVAPDGITHPITARLVNDYLKTITGSQYSAKDFRTWAGTVLVAKELARVGKATSKTDLKRRVAAAIRVAARELGNTPAVCRRAYLHPTVLDFYSRGFTLEDIAHGHHLVQADQAGHLPEELQLLDLFQRARNPR